jgi:hypothetical protein
MSKKDKKWMGKSNEEGDGEFSLRAQIAQSVFTVNANPLRTRFQFALPRGNRNVSSHSRTSLQFPPRLSFLRSLN